MVGCIRMSPFAAAMEVYEMNRLHPGHLPPMNFQSSYAPVPAYLPALDNYMIPDPEPADAPSRSTTPDDWGKGFVSWTTDSDDEEMLHPNDDDRPGVTVTWPSAARVADSETDADLAADSGEQHDEEVVDHQRR